MMNAAELARITLRAALSAGADEADLRIHAGREFVAGVRMGEIEILKEAESRGLQLRVFKGRAKAVVGATDLAPATCERLAKEAVALAAVSEADEFNRLPEPELYAKALPDLDLADDASPPPTARRIEMALEIEAAALAADSRLVNSQGARFARSEGEMHTLTSNGFESITRRTLHALSVAPVARDQSGELVTDSWGKHTPHLADLDEPAALGGEAARRVLRRLDARKGPTGRFPILFESPIAGRFLAMLFGCLAGSAVWRKQSYLAERLGQRIASERFTLQDDPLRPRGLGSRPCDGEGLASSPMKLVDSGVLLRFATDLESARRLGTPPTGHGAWGGGVAPSNLFLLPGTSSLEALIAETGTGLLVTNTLGAGFQPTSGHWSQGCVGLWFEGGEIAYPVKEVTIAGAMDEVLGALDRVGNDLDFSLGAVVSPSFRVAAMTVGGA